MPTRERIVGGLDKLRLVVLRLRDLYLVIVVFILAQRLVLVPRPLRYLLALR